MRQKGRQMPARQKTPDGAEPLIIQEGGEPTRACTHKIAIGDSDLINVRFAPLCGLKSELPRGPRSAISGREQSQQDPRLFDHLVGAREQRRRHF